MAKTVRRGLIGVEDLYTGPNPTFSRSTSSGGSQTLTAVSLGGGTNASIQYVTPTGSDAAAGNTWSLAKATASSAHTALPSTGGIIYIAPSSTGITISSDPFTGMTKNVQVVFLPGIITASVSLTFPTNVAVEMMQGARIQANTGVTVTFRGGFKAPPTTVFTWSGTGAFRFGGQTGAGHDSLTPRISVYWWGAISDATTDSSDAIAAAFAALATGGGIIEMHGRFLSVTAPTLTTSVSNGSVVVEGSGQWLIRSQLAMKRRHTFKGVGSVFSGTLRQVIPRWTIQSNSFASDIAFISMTDTGGNIHFEDVALAHSKNAACFNATETAGIFFRNCHISNSSTGTSAHAIELDGVFWCWFEHCVTSTGASGGYNYHITVSASSAQDCGLHYIKDCQLNTGGIGYSATRSYSSLGNITIKDTTYESYEDAGITFVRSTNLSELSHFVLDRYELADAGVSPAPSLIEFSGSTGTPTPRNFMIRGQTAGFNSTSPMIKGGVNIANLVIDSTQVFTGGIDIGPNQTDWCTNAGVLDSRSMHSSGRFAPYWMPFAAAQAAPSQSASAWSAYTDVGAATTVTTTILAPDGSTTAGTLSGGAGKYVDQNITLAVDDTIIFGAWVRPTTADVTVRTEVVKIQLTTASFTLNDGVSSTATTVSGGRQREERRYYGSQTDWFPIVGMGKITAIGTNPCTVRFSMEVTNVNTSYWKPFLIVIPASSSIPDGAIIRAYRAGAFNNINLNALANEISCAQDTHTYRLPIVKQAGKTTLYNNIATVSGGVPAEYATIDLTAQTANITASTLYAVPASGAGMYRVSGYIVETTAASVSSTLPNLQIVYTDVDSNTSITLDATPILGVAGIGQTGALTANTVGTVVSGVIVINVKLSTTIQYQTVNYASTAAGMAYALHIRLEAM